MPKQPPAWCALLTGIPDADMRVRFPPSSRLSSCLPVAAAAPGALRQGVWSAEASRSRLLLDKVAQEELRPVLAPPGLQAEYANLREQLERTRLRLQREEHGGETGLTGSDTGRRGLNFGGPALSAAAVPAPRPRGSARKELLKLLRRQEKEMEAILKRIKPHDLEFDPRKAGLVVECEAIEALIRSKPRTAFVQYALGREKSVVFVLLGQGTGEIRPVRLPRLRVEEMERLSAAWFQAYSRWRDKSVSPEGQVREWETHVRPVLEQVGAAALEPVLAALPEGLERLVISPHQSLHIFPLHACPVGGGRLLGDQFEVIYTPSFTMLHRCAQRHPDAGGEPLLVECPEGVPERYLPFARAECAALGRRLGGWRRISGDEATAEAVAAMGRDCGLLHYSGHARFNPKKPLKSKLVLTGEPLTLGQVFGGMRLPRNRLVVLSGCESGLLVPDVLDDYVSFTTGFLYAGAPCVVSTLWAIPDLPSALLMDRFYELWLAGLAPAAALRAAQGWLQALRAGPDLNGVMEAFTQNLEDRTDARHCREAAAKYVAGLGERPFASPIHWAAFTCSGVGYGQPCAQQAE